MKDNTIKLYESYLGCIDEERRPNIKSPAYVVINKHYTATVHRATDLDNYLEKNFDEIDQSVFGEIKKKHSDPKEQKRIDQVIKIYSH